MPECRMTIDGVSVPFEPGDTVLEAARRAGVSIPSLCFLKDCSHAAACRMCMVKPVGAARPFAACVTPAANGMQLEVRTPELDALRRSVLDLLARDHRMECDTCQRYSDCEFHAMLREYGLNDSDYRNLPRKPAADNSAETIRLNPAKCILCRRCISACEQHSTGILTVLYKAKHSVVGTGMPLGGSDCMRCGQCVRACPTGAFHLKQEQSRFWRAAADHRTDIAVILASVAGQQIGTLLNAEHAPDESGKLISMLRKLGVGQVYSLTAFDAARKNALEKYAERTAKPVLDPACPAAVRYITAHRPELKELLAPLPTRFEFAAEQVRKLYAETEAAGAGRRLFIVGISGCTAGTPKSADLYLTLPELAELIRQACVSRFTMLKVWGTLPEGSFDAVPGADASFRTVPAVKGRSTIDAIADDGSLGKLLTPYFCPDGCAAGGGTVRLRSAE